MDDTAGTTRSPRSRSLYSLYISDARSVQRPRGSEPASLGELVEAHLFYVIQVAREFRHTGVPLEELLAEGNVGLLEAAQRFDRTRGVKFISYATWWIRKRMWEIVGRQASMVRLPKYKLEKLRRLRAVERELRAAHGRDPEIAQMAEAAGLRVPEVEDLLLHMRREVSLDAVINEESGTRLSDLVAETMTSAPDLPLIAEAPLRALRRFLEHIPKRQREILCLHYGLGQGRPATLAEIGRRMGVSRERVRQLERQGLARLRRLMELDGFATAC